VGPVSADASLLQLTDGLAPACLLPYVPLLSLFCMLTSLILSQGANWYEALILEGSADSRVFEIYIEQVLVPSLSPGQIVVMDNLSIHTGEKVRQGIEAKGCRVLFLPSYSSDLSPIEEAFSKLKAFLRRAQTRTHEALQEALIEALASITTEARTRVVSTLWLSTCRCGRVSRSLLPQSC
jgi:transposase